MNSQLTFDTQADSAGTPLRRNIELKARLPAIEPARERARSIATATLPAEHQVDTYFAVGNGRLKLREINGTKAVLIWYHRSNDTASRASNYLLIPIAEPAQLKLALAGALGVTGIVEKQREIYLYENVRIHLDQVAGRGTFLEFEAVLSPGCDDATGHAQLERLRRHFEIADGNLISGSYGDR